MSNYLIALQNPSAISALIVCTFTGFTLAFIFFLFWTNLVKEVIRTHIPNQAKLVYTEKTIEAEMQILMTSYYLSLRSGGTPILYRPDQYRVTKQTTRFLNQLMAETPELLAEKIAQIRSQERHNRWKKLAGKPLITPKSRV